MSGKQQAQGRSASGQNPNLKVSKFQFEINVMLEVIYSTKRRSLLALNGFLYHEHSKNNKGDRQNWRCCERDSCDARNYKQATVAAVTSAFPGNRVFLVHFVQFTNYGYNLVFFPNG